MADNDSALTPGGDARQFTTPTAGDTRPWVAPSPPSQPLEEPQEAAKWSRLRLRHFTAAGNGVDEAVTGGAASHAVVFARREPNKNYGVSVTPSWSTTVYVALTDKTTTGFTAHFGTNAPGGGGTMSWATFRSEDT